MRNDLLPFLFNAAWQPTVFLVVGALTARLLRRGSARLEYFASAATFAAAALTPWVSLIMFRKDAGVLHRWAWASQPATGFGLWVNGATVASRSGSPLLANASHVLPLLVALIYGLFVLIQLSRLVYGWLLVRRVVARSSRCEDERVLHLASYARAELHVPEAELRISNTALVPFTVGFSKAVVVLPQFLLSDSNDALTLVLAHEFAHVQRRDWMVNALLLVLSLPVSFHPCIGLMRKKVEAAREAACDEVASGCMVSTVAYARALLDLAGRLAQPQPSLVAAYKAPHWAFSTDPL